MSDERRELFALQLDRWWPDLVDALTPVYGAEPSREVALRLAELAATKYRERDPDLHRLDLVRLLQPDWLQQPRMVGSPRMPTDSQAIWPESSARSSTSRSSV